MKFRREGQKNVADEKKNEIDRGSGKKHQGQAWSPSPPGCLRFFLNANLGQTGGAKYAVVVLADAFATIEFPAFGAPCRCLALRVVHASLLPKSGHGKVHGSSDGLFRAGKPGGRDFGQ